MTSLQKPQWLDEWVDTTPGAWKLNPGAPAAVVKEWNVFKAQLHMMDRMPAQPADLIIGDQCNDDW
ncbi:hypothetical protein LCY76_09370 [Fictibacillus sp. KIGAM418]|uniref:Uncharacterized protein n=1 Tax=Fictibacillus marinisediminis TaxID=2878389 RepID=A0A9X1XA86_9BACL|nr:hypothetical protein [Fictibacillus marinisediminis]MCK6256803.1 hypothetical protein [Fictibacillus marinisediminis]